VLVVNGASATAFPNGWYRCHVTFELVGSTPNVTIDIAGAPSGGVIVYVGDNTSGILLWGAQLEEGSFATSYIPTTTAAVTRAGDFASIEGNNFTPWYNPVQGTFGVEFQTIFTTDSISRYILTGNNNHLVYLAADTGTITSFDGQAPVLFGSVSAFGMLAKTYLGYSATGRSLTARGANATSSSTAQNFSGMTTLRIGLLDTIPFCGWIRSIVYYPTRLSDAQMKTLST
jgi:hypothetical protein